jgi:hypothetical protein
LKLKSTDEVIQQVILKSVILTTYEQILPEKEDLLEKFPEKFDYDGFFMPIFLPLYFDSLQVRWADVDAYCRENRIEQIDSVNRLRRKDKPCTMPQSFPEPTIKPVATDVPSRTPEHQPAARSNAETSTTAEQERPAANEEPSEDEPQVAVPILIPANVPPSLWAGKPYQVAFKNLKDKFGEGVIAYILVEKMRCPKTEAGHIIYYPNDGNYKEDRTYQRKIDALIAETNRLYSFTFNE